ncbi:MAG: hypothetical protein L6V93_15160 [Clostridiales bacterium]|nr:MAG: hypothetical protein L6V93_15160 [Clostridiales bacterium]
MRWVRIKSTLSSSPFINPSYISLNTGLASPYARLAFCALTVRFAFSIVKFFVTVSVS